MKTKKNKFSEEIFNFLKTDMIRAADLSFNFLINPTDGKYRYSLSRLWSAKSYLNKSPYFKKEPGGNYLVTPKGRYKIINSLIKDKLEKKTKWKGFWWAVVFDLPEKRRSARDLLRRELKMMKFIEAQKSIWITAYDIEKELLALHAFWEKNLGGNIKILKVEKIIDDAELKRVFGL